MSKTITLNLTEQELATTISGLLFSCSVNVVSNCNEEYQTELYDLAKKLKSYKVDIQLPEIQLLKEENYEDKISERLVEDFKQNLKTIVSFEEI